jgi:DNA-binding CsgD family transcriptional regulator
MEMAAPSRLNPYAVTPPALLQRNKNIVRLVREGKRPAEVARLYGISRQRVLQICNRDAGQQ